MISLVWNDVDIVSMMRLLLGFNHTVNEWYIVGKGIFYGDQKRQHKNPNSNERNDIKSIDLNSFDRFESKPINI